MKKTQLNSLADTGRLMELVNEQGFPCVVSVGPVRRSVNQNDLYWRWLTDMAKWFTARGHEIDKDSLHDLMRHQFLGYEDKQIGRVKIEAQLRSTASLDRAEMAQYMDMVDQWAADKGCLLVKPADSEYVKWMQENGGMA